MCLSMANLSEYQLKPILWIYFSLGCSFSVETRLSLVYKIKLLLLNGSNEYPLPVFCLLALYNGYYSPYIVRCRTSVFLPWATWAFGLLKMF